MRMLSDAEKARVFDRLLEFTEDSFLVVDAQGHIVAISDAYYRAMARSQYTAKEEIMGMDVREVFYNSRLPGILLEKTKVSVIDSFYSGPETAYGPDDFGFNVRTCANIFDYDGRLIGAIAHVRSGRQTNLVMEMLDQAQREVQFYKSKLSELTDEIYSCEEIIGLSPAIMKAKNQVVRAAATDFSVLITGETGTGKELFASSLHNSSNRREKPFIKINCSAIPAELFESELFGYEEGAFTGAQKGGKKGKFELADGGSIFLDEIAEMPMQMQAKLLRVLQEQEIDRVGSSKPHKIDVRVIAATNKDLVQCIQEKTFRADLYYRLNVITIHIPPLRERREDIPMLADHFLSILNHRYGTQKYIAPSAMEALKAHAYPGNIRELKNNIERMFAFGDNTLLTIPNKTPAPTAMRTAQAAQKHAEPGGTLNDQVAQFECTLILDALKRNHYNYRRTAEELGLTRGTLYHKIKKYQIQRPDREPM